MIQRHMAVRILFILFCAAPYVFSEDVEKPAPLIPQEKIEFPLKKEWLEKRYKKRDITSKIKLFCIVHNVGLNSTTTKKILEILPKEISISITPYVKQSKDILKTIKQKGYNVLWIQPMELYRQQNDVLDPYRLSRSKDKHQNAESVTNSFSNIPEFISSIVADETSPVLRDEETLLILLAELKKRNLALLSPEMSVNSEFMELCSAHGVKCDEADYFISRTDTEADVISKLNRVKELGEQTGYVICVIDAYIPHVVNLLDWYDRLDKRQFELSSYS